MSGTKSQPALPIEPQFADRLQNLFDRGANNEEKLTYLYELARRAEDPDFEPKTLGELFGDGEAINVLGLELPPDLPGLADTPIDFELMKGPAKRILRQLRAIERLQKALDISIQQFDQRVQRAAQRAVRKVKGGNKLVKTFQQHQAVKRLRPFGRGEPSNSIIFTNQGATVTIGVELPGFAMPDITTMHYENEEALIAAIADDVCMDLLDHTQAVVMATSAVTGHDRVNRIVVGSITYLNDEGVVTEASFLQTGKRRPTIVVLVTRFPTNEERAQLAPGQARVDVTLEYSVRVGKLKVGELLDHLAYLRDLPVAKGAFPTEEDEAGTGNIFTSVIEGVHALSSGEVRGVAEAVFTNSAKPHTRTSPDTASSSTAITLDW